MDMILLFHIRYELSSLQDASFAFWARPLDIWNNVSYGTSRLKIHQQNSKEKIEVQLHKSSWCIFIRNLLKYILEAVWK